MTRKRILIFSLITLVLLLIVFNKPIRYYLHLAKGQLSILINSKPIWEVIASSETPDSVRNKLLLILEIKQFAEDSIGLKKTDNYETYYDCKNSALVWIVTACDAFSFNAVEWGFPIVGTLSYKGFFDKEKAEQLALSLKAQGYDVEVSPVSAWSTLGWFDDPVFSTFLSKSEGQLASLIIHELTHATVFRKNDLNFNENLANITGEIGALKFLKTKFGINSAEYIGFQNYLNDKETYVSFLHKKTKLLDSLYHSPDFILADYAQKAEIKRKNIENIIKEAKCQNWISGDNFVRSIKTSAQSGNAYFIDFLRYDSKRDSLENILNNRFYGDLRNFIISFQE